MCEATVFLDDEVILRDVMSIQVVPGGVRLTSMFEPGLVVPAAIREIDLSNHRVHLAALRQSK